MRAIGARRAILHVDMDAFFVSVELLRRPELRGQPVIVGGAGERGVVAAASYEARHYGIHSAMASSRARQLCPHAVFLSGDHAHYSVTSRRVMAIFRSVTPLVEPISLDEAFLDVTGSQRLFGPAPEIAVLLRQRVLDEEGLTCSVGVAGSKLIAKLASEAAKPLAGPTGPRPGLGVMVVEAGQENRFLHGLPVQALWGVGPKTLEKLLARGITTVGDLAALDEETSVRYLGGAHGRHLWRLSQGIDAREVEPDQRPKSVGHEETFARDHHSLESLRPELVRMADAVSARLRDHHQRGRTVTVKVRFGDFRTVTRSHTLPSPVASGPAVARVAKKLLEQIDPAGGVRLLGVSVSHLCEDGAHQLSLEGQLGPGWPEAAWEEATKAVDRIRRRFGHDAIVPAVLSDGDRIRIKRRGEGQWGPDGQVP